MDELLTCSVCCERYCESERQPVLLPRCGHSFCRPCVTLLVSSSCIICPTCRTDQRLESAHRLPTEYTLLAIIAAQESSKLDNCRRHDVKLSFWCQTCSQPTCGECLFEDHPTHSHDVIRATTYVENIKGSVHEVACKFMEALDTREQSFYRTVYTCAKRIDDALRNVTVLRKDMGEARHLMKGIKEEDTSISTATSLAEAAKYLGLKWNIQDANFNRNQKEEKDRDKEDANSRHKDKGGKHDKGSKEKKKKHTHGDKENNAENAGEDKDNLKEIKPEKPPETAPIEPTLPATPSSGEVQAPKDDTRKPALRKSKTLSVFEPLSMDKEITDIKEKIVQLDNRERERLEAENLKLIEDEEQSEVKKKIIASKKNEAAAEIEAIIGAVNAATGPDDEMFMKKKQEEKEVEKRAEEQEALNKAAEEELQILNQILKRPRGRLARKFLAEKERAEKESAKLASEQENSAKGSDDSNFSAEKEKESEDNGKEKTNGHSEHPDKEKDLSARNIEPPEGVDEEDEVVDADPYAGELTLEEKEAKKLSARGEEDGRSVFDFMRAPLFTVCVEGAEGRLALLRCESRGLHVYCHQYQQLEYDIAIKSSVLQTLIPSKSPLVFLELSVGSARARRVYIRLWGQLRRAHNFLALCIGDQGSALLNTKLLQIYNLNEPGERILGGDHEYNCGRGGCALLDDLEWNGDYTQPMREGLLTAAGSGQHATNSLFLVCTRSDMTRNFSCPFGEIVQGLENVRDSIRRSAETEEEVWITGCGVVLEPPGILRGDRAGARERERLHQEVCGDGGGGVDHGVRRGA